MQSLASKIGVCFSSCDTTELPFQVVLYSHQQYTWTLVARQKLVTLVFLILALIVLICISLTTKCC